MLYNGKYGEALLSTDSGNNFNDLKLDMPRDWMGCGVSYDGKYMIIGESGGWHYSTDGGHSFKLLDYKTGLSLGTAYETNPSLTITDNGKLFTPSKFVDLQTNTSSNITGVSGAVSRSGQIIYLATSLSNQPLKKSVDTGLNWSDTASISGAVSSGSLIGASSDGSKILLCG
ncbi:hypothetical protein COT94_02880 [Candidatus Falkowbacteria bacterium CG10_big_fil_rev_8_21_14_0_10_37_14]|uniref:Photosynthesis system II assembly factor Ycf48/Hcf136-like domain-containing protein n=1 Tax=Candidatus Falkowbacteria bacterium CG10_big_fil_rev_8_21_14_0_10_37_14 TaxID=1974561 RepID=A0A2M6WT43_9BACT|nr:hypothetical protein [Candidatus Falkowbacteria bacterium]PIT95969.1 MAG: hypothetical protein COT94_02880 [Candidatus Falkowbacteria bacterium CG10_big_fil_rev_8_21_14_0_10_37_14]